MATNPQNLVEVAPHFVGSCQAAKYKVVSAAPSIDALTKNNTQMLTHHAMLCQQICPHWVNLEERLQTQDVPYRWGAFSKSMARLSLLSISMVYMAVLNKHSSNVMVLIMGLAAEQPSRTPRFLTINMRQTTQKTVN